MITLRLPYPLSGGRNQHTTLWTKERVDFLIENYPKKGKVWCVEQLGMLEHQIRSKSSRLGLVARGVSDAWKESVKIKAANKIGIKRPEQALVMNRLRDEGKLVVTEQMKLNLSVRMKEQWAKNEHPRGMLGKTHSEKSRAKMSSSGVIRMATESSEVKSARVMKMLKTKEANGNLYQSRRQTSWKAGWREIGGQRCYFRSRWEANYARYLQFLLEKKLIAKWEHEPETFWFEAIKRGCRSYLPDFRVTECSGAIAYHEVKGWMDDRSKTKIKRMRIYHPNVKLIVIAGKDYRQIYRKLGPMLVGWEK